MELQQGNKANYDHPVIFEKESHLMKVILNRPRKLNSLNYEMVTQMLRELTAQEEDPTIKLVILKGNGKAFCVGGDIVATYQTALEGHWSFPLRFYNKQLTLDYLLATYNKTVVSLIDGTVMGGGAGLTMLTPFRIVTEKAVFSMPEALIGAAPDVGASYFLSRLPGYFGEYLGLSGARLDGNELLACGLATHLVPSKDLPLLENALENLDSGATTVSEIINRYAGKPNIKENSPCMRMMLINKCFSKDTVEEILQALEYEVSVGSVEKWLTDATKFIKQACPSSLKVFLKGIREGRKSELDQCLTRDYHMGSNLISSSLCNNFYEGIRAMLIDKDKKPKWQPSKLELVSQEMVDKYFVHVDHDEVEPLKLRIRSCQLNKSVATNAGQARL